MAFPSAALFLLLYSSGRLTQAIGQGQGSDQRFHGGFGRLLLKCWCISHAFAPTVHPFYYFLSTQVIILDLPLFVPNSHWESLIVSIMTTFAGVFCCRFLSIWCPHSFPALIDCTYPGLFTVTVPNAHTSSGLLGFCVSKRHFCVSPLLYKLKSK